MAELLLASNQRTRRQIGGARMRTPRSGRRSDSAKKAAFVYGVVVTLADREHLPQVKDAIGAFGVLHDNLRGSRAA